MKIALCFSGHLRDLNETKDFWKSLIQKYDIDVYGSFWDAENEELDDTIHNFKTIYNPKLIEVEKYEIFKQTTQELASLHVKSPMILGDFFGKISKSFVQLSMYYKIWKCNLLSKQFGEKYDLVIRARTDCKLDDKFEIIHNDMLNIPMGIGHCNSFPNSESINDCFAYGTPKIMNYYSFIYLQMMNYLEQNHYVFPPEHFLKVHFSRINLRIRLFPNYITLTRKSKGGEDEITNRFITSPIETVIDSQEHLYIGNKELSFFNNNFREDFSDWLVG